MNFLGAMLGCVAPCIELLFGVVGIPMLPGMVGETAKGATIAATEYGADWYKTMGKVFENFFKLSIV